MKLIWCIGLVVWGFSVMAMEHGKAEKLELKEIVVEKKEVINIAEFLRTIGMTSDNFDLVQQALQSMSPHDYAALVDQVTQAKPNDPKAYVLGKLLTFEKYKHQTVRERYQWLALCGSCMAGITTTALAVIALIIAVNS